jgi:hypothetical protein
MNVVEFDTVVKDGKIEVPRQYQIDFLSSVRVIFTHEDDRKSIAGRITNPQEQKKVLLDFFEKWDALDEPLGKEFDEAVNGGLTFNTVDL